MKAAVLHVPGEAPRFEEFPEPVPAQDEMLVQVKAAPLTNLSKMRANAAHTFPVVCGVNGVALLEDGTRVYCGGCRGPYGMMAERSVVTLAWCLPIPDEVDDLTAAALPNAALASWLALVFRARLRPGETVLILGATGVSGRLAIQVARQLGAGRVVATGRNEGSFPSLLELGADAVISLGQTDQALTEAFAHEAARGPFDIILDFLWGHPTEVLMKALNRQEVMARASRIRFVSIGEMAGSTASIPVASLHSSGLEISGSGGGSLSHQELLEIFPRMFALAAQGKLRIDIEALPLAEVENAWSRQDTQGKRLVFLP
ncbi:zinc-binding alcohol dehydrogenase family protein [Ktedonosporobacter rubrisoli]|uniref:Zinc-binding alcohol dehydrogenase family protein n=1 Tax=Ktedonosporobacter rubrisoli TaxID=2509675 RepID=A0A4P6JMN1_KTERU|nr:zinc-binding alcohol dehydrogenase family protein [Ktedonosporobacter rubrisoli]QBD76282.1 zinc-binding alcohol dehydrogenase family protein [Ktedonosporobacter rubrisoli]